MGKRNLCNQLVGAGMHNGGGKVQYGWYAGVRIEICQGEDWWVRYGAGLYKLRLCLL